MGRQNTSSAGMAIGAIIAKATGADIYDDIPQKARDNVVHARCQPSWRSTAQTHSSVGPAWHSLARGPWSSTPLPLNATGTAGAGEAVALPVRPTHQRKQIKKPIKENKCICRRKLFHRRAPKTTVGRATRDTMKLSSIIVTNASKTNALEATITSTSFEAAGWSLSAAASPSASSWPRSGPTQSRNPLSLRTWLSQRTPREQCFPNRARRQSEIQQRYPSGHKSSNRLLS